LENFDAFLEDSLIYYKPHLLNNNFYVYPNTTTNKLNFQINMEEILVNIKTKTNYKKDLIFYNEDYIGYIEIKFYNDVELW